MDILKIICIILFIIFMAIIPYFSQFNLVEINDKNFKLIKIKRLSFLFRAIGGESVKKQGIILSLLFIQILGDVFSIISAILFPILVAFRVELNLIFIVISINFGVICLITVIIELITMMISRHRDYKRGND